jgi:muconolactone delta-isomerase
MLYYSRMRWAIAGMTFDQLWKLEGKEAEAAVASIEQGIVAHLYKPCAERAVISVGATRTVEEFDRYAMGVLPMREHLIFDEVAPLTEGFSIEVFPYLEARAAEMADRPRLLHLVELSWPAAERRLDAAWPGLVADLSGVTAPKIVSLYRVTGLQRALLFADLEEAAELDRLVARDSLAGAAVTRVEALRDYLGFARDVWKGYRLDAAE